MGEEGGKKECVRCSDGSMFRRLDVSTSVETATLNLFFLFLGSMFRQFDVSTGQCFDILGVGTATLIFFFQI